MSSGNPDRARRDRKSVDYTTKSLDAEMRDAFDEAYGDKSTLDVAGAPTELDINESRAVDKTFRSSRNVDSDDSDDYDSDDLAEDDDGNPVRLARKKKKEKSEAEVAAEQAVAQGLNLSYPEGFKQTRKGLRYAAMACSVGSKRQGVRYALNRVIVDDALTPADRELVINMADEIGRTIRVPNQYLADTFEPLSNFNGGIYTKTGQNMGMLSAIAMGVHMAAELPEFRANGSAQAQGFAAVLGVAGLGGDIVSMLTDQHTDETPEQSARNGARKIVEQLNALTDADLVASLYHNIANFPQRARTMMAGRELKHEYDYTHFDSTKPKGWTDISQKKAVVSVGLTLLHRTSPADSYSKHLASHYGADSAPDAAGYKPCYSFPDSKFVPTQTQLDSVGSQAWINVRDNEPDEVKAARRALDAFRADPGDEQSEALGYHEFAKRVHKLARVFEDVRKKAVNVERRKLLATEEAAYYKKCEELGEYVETHRAQVDITPFTRSMTGGRAEVVGALKSMLLSTKSEDKETAPKLKDYLSSLPRLLATRRDKDGDGLDPLFSNYWGNFQGAYLGIKANGVTCRLGRKAERKPHHPHHPSGRPAPRRREEAQGDPAAELPQARRRRDVRLPARVHPAVEAHWPRHDRVLPAPDQLAARGLHQPARAARRCLRHPVVPRWRPRHRLGGAPAVDLRVQAGVLRQDAQGAQPRRHREEAPQAGREGRAAGADRPGPHQGGDGVEGGAPLPQARRLPHELPHQVPSACRRPATRRRSASRCATTPR